MRRTRPGSSFSNIGRLNDIDLRDFGTGLDFLGTDLYPGLRDEFMKVGLGYAQAMQLDSFRGWAGNFIVPELQLGAGAHPAFAIPAPEPGELGRFAFSSVARGADGLIWFRWTSARYGAEAYWIGALDHDRVPRRRYAELKQTISELKAVRDEVLGRASISTSRFSAPTGPTRSRRPPSRLVFRASPSWPCRFIITAI